jgi:hypothetical protein
VGAQFYDVPALFQPIMLPFYVTLTRPARASLVTVAASDVRYSFAPLLTRERITLYERWLPMR